jgi:hypothetical protein
MLEALPKALNLKALRDAPDEGDGVDGGAHFLQQRPDEAGLVHAVGEQILPEVRVVLFLGEGYGARDVAELVDDQR